MSLLSNFKFVIHLFNFYLSVCLWHRSLWINCIISEILILRLIASRKLERNKVKLHRKWNGHWRYWKKKKVGADYQNKLLIFNLLSILSPPFGFCAFLISNRVFSTKIWVFAAEGQVPECDSRLQCCRRGVSFPCCEAGAWTGGGLEHIRGAILEKRKFDQCYELLYWCLATGTADRGGLFVLLEISIVFE